jgi:DNA replication and repair protein RecF
MYFAPMLRLNKLSLYQFRNYIHEEFVFTNRIVGIVGGNGIGKTNILDAIYYLSFTKSYFNRPDVQNVHHFYKGMRIQGFYEMNVNSIEVTCILRENLKKEFYFNQEQYSKLSQHIGKIPSVMIAPDDVQIITGTSEERRKLIDSLLSQMYPTYLDHLIKYNKVLTQRNSLLKNANDYGKLDTDLLEILNQQLIENGAFIFEFRSKLNKEFFPVILKLYEKIAGKMDQIDIKYHSQLQQDSFSSLLKNSLIKDKLLQRTTNGIHKDDLIITIQDQPFKQEASQGQRKSFLFAIRFAEWELIKSCKGYPPILLMDDIFEKLDEKRMIQLLSWVSHSTDGQVFITDTHLQRMDQLLGKHLHSFQIIKI